MSFKNVKAVLVSWTLQKPLVKFNFGDPMVRKLQLRQIQVSRGRYGKDIGSSLVSDEASKGSSVTHCRWRTQDSHRKCQLVAPCAYVSLRCCRRRRRMQLGEIEKSVLDVVNCTELWRWNELWTFVPQWTQERNCDLKDHRVLKCPPCLRIQGHKCP